MLRFLFNLLSGKIRRFASFMCVSLFMLTAVGGLEPSPVAAQVQIKGYLDFYEYNVIPNTAPALTDSISLSGWACAPGDPNRILRIDVYHDTEYFGSLYANQQREASVGNECGGNPYQGFSGTINFSPRYHAEVFWEDRCVYAVYSDTPRVEDTIQGGGGYTC